MSGSGKTKDRVLLTAKAIDAFKAEAEPYRVPDVRAAGLALRVAASGKTWDLSYRIKGGSVRRLSLGRFEDVGLEAARSRANELTGAARQGVDRIAKEREAIEAKARAMSVGKFIELYLARRVRGRLRSAPTMERILCRVLRPLASMPAADVRKRDLLPLFELIAAVGHERAAGRARQIVGGLCKWGVSVDILTNDPTAGLPSYDLGKARDRVLSEDEIRLLWPWLETLPAAIADALRVQLLTGARSGEVGGMTVEEIDRGKWLWTLPAARSKNKRSRTTPIVGLARTIIEARMSEGPLFVSDNGVTLTSHRVASALLLRRSKFPIEVFTSHDLRRTMATLMHEKGTARDVIGAVVGHDSEDGKSSRTLVKHYLMSDLIELKTNALEKWDAQLKAILANKPTNNVVRLRRGS